jgi:hypothetical protein
VAGGVLDRERQGEPTAATDALPTPASPPTTTTDGRPWAAAASESRASRSSSARPMNAEVTVACAMRAVCPPHNPEAIGRTTDDLSE